MFNTVNQGQSVTNNYAGSDWFVHQVFLTGRCNKKHQSNGHYSPIFTPLSSYWRHGYLIPKQNIPQFDKLTTLQRFS